MNEARGAKLADALHEAYTKGYNDAATEQEPLDEDAFTEAGIALLDAPETERHDCAHWRAEGIGCASCNPIARAVAQEAEPVGYVIVGRDKSGLRWLYGESLEQDPDTVIDFAMTLTEECAELGYTYTVEPVGASPPRAPESEGRRKGQRRAGPKDRRTKIEPFHTERRLRWLGGVRYRASPKDRRAPEESEERAPGGGSYTCPLCEAPRAPTDEPETGDKP